MVRDPRHQHTNIDTPFRRRLECIEQDVIWHKVGVGEQDCMLSTVDSVDIHIADRKGQTQSIITAQIDQGIKAAFVVSGNFIAIVTETIPEGNKRAGKLAGIRSTNTE